MKISQMTTDQAADVLVKIAEPASNIMHDEETIALIERLANGDDNPIRFLADNIVPITSAALKTHREDTYAVVGALCDKSVEEVASQKITQTIRDIKDSVDGDLVDFFASLK